MKLKPILAVDETLLCKTEQQKWHLSCGASGRGDQISTTSRSYINISLSGGSCQIKGTNFLIVEIILLEFLRKILNNCIFCGK